jgi:hypothetical protein
MASTYSWLLQSTRKTSKILKFIYDFGQAYLYINYSENSQSCCGSEHLIHLLCLKLGIYEWMYSAVFVFSMKLLTAVTVGISKGGLC